MWMWTSTRVLDVSVSEVCVCVASSHLEQRTGGDGYTHNTQQWQAAGALAGVPLHRKIDRHRARAAKLAVSLSFALRCSQSVPLSAPAADAQPVTRGRYRLLLVPSQTSQNTSYHLIRLLLGPLRLLEVFDDCQYYHALARISPFRPASSRALLFLPLSPRKTKPPNDRPTDGRPNPARIYLQDHEMRADGACV